MIKKCRGRLAEVENEFVKINDESAEEEMENNTLKEDFSEAQPIMNKAPSRNSDPNDVPF